jgi:DNA-binding response OmpR family regulator
MNKYKIIIRDTDSTSNILINYLLNLEDNIECDRCDSYDIMLSKLSKNHYDYFLFNPGLFYKHYLDLTKQVKEQYKNMKIIILNSHIFNGDKKAWIDNGIDIILSKPFDFDILKRIINNDYDESDDNFFTNNRVNDHEHQIFT